MTFRIKVHVALGTETSWREMKTIKITRDGFQNNIYQQNNEDSKREMTRTLVRMNGNGIPEAAVTVEQFQCLQS
jgi:hypothetical protein